MVSVVTAELYHSCMKTAADNTRTNEQGCDPIKLYLSMLKFEFPIVFCVTKYHSIFDIFPTIEKNVKAFLRSQTIQTQVVGWIVPVDYSLTSCSAMVLYLGIFFLQHLLFNLKILLMYLYYFFTVLC